MTGRAYSEQQIQAARQRARDRLLESGRIREIYPGVPISHPGVSELMRSIVDHNESIRAAIWPHVRDWDARGPRGVTALMLAAKTGHQSAIRDLLREGAEGSRVDEQGWNALRWAVESRQEQSALALMNSKGAAEIAFQKDVKGVTPLMRAVELHLSKVVEKILENPWGLGLADGSGQTAISRALKGSLPEMRALIASAADASAQCDGDPLALALVKKDEVSALLIFLRNHPKKTAALKLNELNEAGETVLMLATRRGLQNAVPALLDAGASPTVASPEGETAITIAISRGETDFALAMLNHMNKEDLARTYGGLPLLHRAIMAHNEVLVGELLRAGARPGALDNKGRTAIALAKELGAVRSLARLTGKSGRQKWHV